MKKLVSSVILFALVFVSNAQYENLLVNAGHTDSTEGWTIEANGGSGVRFLPEKGALRTSHSLYTESQTINLLNIGRGFTAAYLDTEPIILYSSFFQGYDDNGNQSNSDVYFLNVYLYDKDMNGIDSFESGFLNTMNSLEQIKGSFRNYGKGVRFIKFEQGGKDGDNWKGNYGPEIDNSYLSIGNHLMYTEGNIGSFAGWENYNESFWSLKTINDKKYFSTSYKISPIHQIIDLMDLGYTSTELDKSPIISGGENYIGTGVGSSYDDNFSIKVELMNSKMEVIHTFYKLYVASEEWQSATFEIENYAQGVRYIKYSHHGDDGPNDWKGYYGSKMDKPYLLIGENKVLNTNLKEVNTFKNLTIYPNPTQETLNIEIEHNGNIVGTTCTISDLHGRIIKSFDVSQNQSAVNVEDIEAGVYLITLTNLNTNIKQTRRFIKN